MNGQQNPGWYFAHAQNLNLYILRMIEGILFSLDAARIILWSSNIMQMWLGEMYTP